tara:strand:+ start:511 stop:918 length:408 start_codon:yes stop_codon:yes gene_type:complete
VAVFAATDFNITIGGADFSGSLAAVTLDISREQLETTAFGDAARTYIAGLQDATLTLSFHQDFAASAVDSTLHSALGSEVAVVIKPTSAAVGATNPTYSFNALVTQIQPFASNVGDLATQDVTFPVSGAITRATS